MFSVDEACIFLGAIKRGGSDGAQMLQSNEEIETSLNQTEFTEYVLRGLNQTARSMRTFASRSEMHHKISRVLKVISESALADYQSRAKGLVGSQLKDMAAVVLLCQVDVLVGSRIGSADAR